MATEQKQIRLRRDTAARWTQNNPVIAAGEIAVDIDNGYTRIGTSGAQHYLDLPVFATFNPQNGNLHAAVLAALDARYASGVTPEMFGAVGDGVANDAAAVQAAFDAVKVNGGGVVRFAPRKAYWVSEAVIVSSNTIVDGNGARMVKRQGSASRCVFANKSADGAVGYGAGGQNITIRDLLFVGDYTIPKANYQDIGTGWNHVQNLTFENCSFEQGMNNSHYIDLLGCTDVRIIGCRFKGMNPNSGREYIEAIQVDVSTRQATSFDDETVSAYDGLPTRGVLVTACTFVPVTVAGTEYPAPNPIGSHSAALTDDSGYYRDIRFVDNLYNGWSTPATNETFGLLHFRGVSGLHIGGNTFIYRGPGGSGYPTVISVIPVTTVTPANQVQVAAPTNTTLGTARNNRGVTIIGNRFIGWASATTQAAARLVNLDTVNGATVSDNTCDGTTVTFAGATASRADINGNDIVLTTTQPGVHLSGCVSATVRNNSITGFAGGTNVQTDRGINLRVSSNTMTGGAVGIRANGADNSLIQDNYVRDFTSTGISVGEAGYGFTHFDCIVSVNRVRSTTSGVTSLAIGSTSTRTRRIYNLLRDPGTVTDTGTGTTGAATDATA